MKEMSKWSTNILLGGGGGAETFKKTPLLTFQYLLGMVSRISGAYISWDYLLYQNGTVFSRLIDNNKEYQEMLIKLFPTFCLSVLPALLKSKCDTKKICHDDVVQDDTWIQTDAYYGEKDSPKVMNQWLWISSDDERISPFSLSDTIKMLSF